MVEGDPLAVALHVLPHAGELRVEGCAPYLNAQALGGDVVVAVAAYVVRLTMTTEVMPSSPRSASTAPGPHRRSGGPQGRGGQVTAHDVVAKGGGLGELAGGVQGVCGGWRARGGQTGGRCGDAEGARVRAGRTRGRLPWPQTPVAVRATRAPRDPRPRKTRTDRRAWYRDDDRRDRAEQNRPAHLCLSRPTCHQQSRSWRSLLLRGK